MDKITCKHCGCDNKSYAKYCMECGFELPRNEVITQQQQTTMTTKQKFQSEKKNKFIGLVVGAIVFAVTSFAVQHFIFGPPSVDKALSKTADEINKSCPIRVDEYTRLENAIALPNKTFRYNYTLVDLTKSEVNIDTVKKYVEPTIFNKLKTDPDLKYFRDNEITMIYNYSDKNGEFVVKFTYTPDMYK